MTRKASICITALAGLAWGGIPPSELELARFTIDGGGTMRSTGGDFDLSGTIGQPDAGVLTGDRFTLTGGFWFSTPPGDCNADGATGQLDITSFVDCMGGPGRGPPMDPCLCFDVDGSGSVDLADFAVIQKTFVGQ